MMFENLHTLAGEPLVRAVLDRLLEDEGAHARIGHWFLEWAADRLTEPERVHLAELALSTLEVYRPIWAGDACGSCASAVGLGGHDEQGRQALRAAVTTRIAVPLARHGIVIDAARLE